MASAADVEEWCQSHPAGNIALRLPPGAIGIDADAWKGPAQAAAWHDLTRRFGPLPETAPWCSSRDDGISGIRLCSVPDDYVAADMGPAGEVIQHHWRYVVAPPSISPPPPRGNTKPYRWIGRPDGYIPAVSDLPPLPAAWLDGLRAHSNGHAAKGFQQPGSRSTTWTDPDVSALAASGIPGDASQGQDSYLRDLVWSLVAAGLDEEAVRAVWDTTVARTPLQRPGDPWTTADFRRHYRGAARKAGASAPAAQPGSSQERTAIDSRKGVLRIEAQARDELAAETMPPVPAGRRGDAFLAEPDDTPAWRIDGLWPANGNIVLAAQFKAGKTTLRDNLIRSWCDGEQFLGAYDIEPPGGPLAVIDAEMSDATARRWLRMHRIARPAGFTYIGIRGAAASMNLVIPSARARWAKLLAGAGAVLLDCLGPVMGALGLDENKPADVGRFLAAFEQLLAEAGVPESFLIHHMGHGAERARGASRLRDWPDAEWRLVRRDDDPASPRYLSAFGRDVDIPESRLAFNAETRRLTIDGGSRRDDEVSAARLAVAALLAVSPRLSGRQIEAALTSHGRNSIRGAITAAVRAGEVSTEPGPRGASLHTLSAPVRRSAPPLPGALAPSARHPYRGGALAHSPAHTHHATTGGALETGEATS